MKALRLLGLPWMAWSKDARQRIGVLSVAIIALVALVMAATHQHGVAPSLHTIHLLALLNGLLWAFALSQTMLLAREAHRLRLPELIRLAHASMMLYAAITIILPALLLTWLGANGVIALVELALGAGIGLGYAALPAWLGICTWLAFIVPENTLVRWLPMPTHSIPSFLAWATPTALVLWLLIVIFWLRAIRHEDGLRGINKPILFSWRTKSWYGRDNLNPAMESLRLRRRVRWWHPVVDLRSSGPSHVVASLRVALGGWAMPLTSTSRLRQIVVWIAVLGLGIAFAIITLGGNQQQGGNLYMAWMYAIVAGPLLAEGHARLLQRRWNRVNAELPLLALLPGLGSRTPVKHDLLRACLLPTFTLQCVAAAAVFIAAAWCHLPITGWVELLLAQLLGMGLLAALTLSTLSGHPIVDSWSHKALLIGFLIATGVGMAVISTTPSSSTAMLATLLVLAIFWSFLFVPLVLVAVDGWRRFQHRPHPFLANQP